MSSTRTGRESADTALLFVLGVAVLTSPDAVPGLTIPGGGGDGAMMMR